jgi:hypothetical protein
MATAFHVRRSNLSWLTHEIASSDQTPVGRLILLAMTFNE